MVILSNHLGSFPHLSPVRVLFVLLIYDIFRTILDARHGFSEAPLRQRKHLLDGQSYPGSFGISEIFELHEPAFG